MGYDPVPGSYDATKLQGYPISPGSPTNGGALIWNSSLFEWVPSLSAPGTGDALISNPLSQFASTTSAQLAGVISNETGTDKLVFSDSPNLTGTPTAPTASAATNTTQIATTAFVTGAVATAVTGLLNFKGSTDCSANPNYPSAVKGDAYIVSVAGKIGGASGTSVDVGDWYVAEANNAGGTEASVGTSWGHMEHNLVGALLASNNLSDLASASTARTNLGVAIGADVQAYSAVLATYAGITPSSNAQTLLGHTFVQMRTDLGATTVGGNIFQLTNPGAITFLQLNADNSVTAQSASAQRTALSLVPGTDVVAFNGALGTPSSGTATNLSGTAASLNIGGSAASLSISGQTGLLTFTGLASTNRVKTVRDAADTILELGGSYTPTGTWTNLTMVTPVLGTPASGNASNLTALNATQLTSGTVPLARLSGITTTQTSGIAASGANTDITSVLLNQTGLVVKGGDSNALTIKPNETLTAGRILNLIVNDAARTINLSGNLTVSSAATISGTNTGDQTTVTGNAGTATALQTARAIYGNNFDGTAALAQIIASTYGGTGNGFTKFSGPTTSEKTKTLRDATDTILELGGSYTPTGTWTSLTLVTPALGTPASGTLTNCTFPTLNQNTSGSAATLTTGRTLAITGDLTWTSPSFDGSGNVTAAGTLASVASAGTTGSSTAIPVITINAKGLTTSITTAAVIAPAGTLSGATLNSGVTASSLTSFGNSPTLSTAVLTGLPTGTGVSSAATASTLTARDANANITANNWLGGYTTTTTAAGTTTLTVGSAYVQFFTGSTTQTVTLPVASTLTLGHQFVIVNNSTGLVTVNSSGANAVIVLAGSTQATITCILASGTTAASWNASYFGDVVTSGKKLSISNTLTLAGTDATTMTFPSTSATIARTDAANTFTGHQTIEGVTSTGATGTGKFVFDGSGTLVTPKIAQITAPSDSTTAFLLANAAGTAYLTGDSTNGNLGLGMTPNNYAGIHTISLAGSTGGLVELVSGVTVMAQNYCTSSEVRYVLVGSGPLKFLAADASVIASMFAPGGTRGGVNIGGTVDPGATNLQVTGKTIFGAQARLKSYTVSTLPSGTEGDTAYVTDALAPSFLAVVVGGGSTRTPVFYNGTSWVGY